MNNEDTAIGGWGRGFPSTQWSQFLRGPAGDDATRKSSLQALALKYWKPVYYYIRLRWSKSNEDAKDLTQDFFLWMMETDFVGQADPQRGRFRSFVKVALEQYLRGEERKRRTQKRGGEHRILNLDGAAFEVPDPSEPASGEIMDEAWKDELLARATGHLAESYRREGKETYFQVFREYYLRESDGLGHEELATKYGIPTTDVSNYLTHAKRRFRAILKDLVAETVRGPDELREEFKALFGDAPP